MRHKARPGYPQTFPRTHRRRKSMPGELHDVYFRRAPSGRRPHYTPLYRPSELSVLFSLTHISGNSQVSAFVCTLSLEHARRNVSIAETSNVRRRQRGPGVGGGAMIVAVTVSAARRIK